MTDPRFTPEPDHRPQVDWPRFLLGLVAAALFAYAGLQMVNLRTESGRTVVEIFDQAMGWFSWGMAALSAAWALSWSR